MRREIRAQAFANIVGSLVSAQPASVSLTRSALLRQMPNTTRMAPIVTAIATIPLVIAAPLERRAGRTQDRARVVLRETT